MQCYKLKDCFLTISLRANLTKYKKDVRLRSLSSPPFFPERIMYKIIALLAVDCYYNYYNNTNVPLYYYKKIL